ncbi:hypothetical protein [Halomonas elongata]|uniref:Uncharacterized protein n=1 Tax=Halomonas elongata (strain ATCC 33173 / DSM 2581 / NBRC 15536 / NCIMB 2198 / 1H9) TaxID=768066 RepID=E1VA61_HALED|nr:hypothetical protein [Halomonas elongata]WBF17691.1 hypothetical protein LM502_16690 [Halomonas elongata]WPU46532.1 hypothetical protein SR933_14925 [Halomonas elongata DSM 2581]CBV43949.1 uncharacterized protein HELO_4065 [Halomonas elongata DSM 2581]
MNTIVMSGETGVGKTRVVEALGVSRRVMLVDPLLQWSVPTAPAETVPGDGHQQWSAPTGPADLVVFDHLSFLPDAEDQVRQATAWCEAHQANLLLVVQFQEDLASLGISIPSDEHATVSLSRSPQAEALRISIRYPGETTDWNATFDTYLHVADSTALTRLLKTTTNRRSRKAS